MCLSGCEIPGASNLSWIFLIFVQGGLLGLIMRLRQDGHAALTVAGPRGIGAVVEAGRHFVTWRYPTVSCLDCDPGDPSVIYKVT